MCHICLVWPTQHTLSNSSVCTCVYSLDSASAADGREGTMTTLDFFLWQVDLINVVVLFCLKLACYMHRMMTMSQNSVL